MPRTTPCPSTWRCVTGETVRCIWPAGHQHALDARERLQEQHEGMRRDRARVTWLSD